MKQSKMSQGLLAAAVCGVIATTSVSYAADPMTNATGGNVASADRSFIEKATIGGMTEVEAGKLAQEKATNPDVKKYGAELVADHTKAGAELTKLSSAKSVTPPGTLDKSHRGDVDKLAKLSGADFDKAFIKQMVSDHKSTVSLFEKEAKSGKDGELKQFASATLPTLQEHLTMAKSIEDKLK